MWAGCVAGALEEDEYRALLADAGFEEIDIEPTRVYGAEDVKDVLAEFGIDTEAGSRTLDDRLMSAFVRARKPLD